ncbi:MAG TPA: Wzz/FepE/Etk N-terminal domain-containing protein, partial [Thermoleophilaceae bacterium]
MNATEPSPDASWLNPSIEQQGLARYVSTIRERKWLIALTVLVTTLAAVAYVLTASKVYNAEADLLITPIGNTDPTLSGLGLISSSSDPTRDVETASKLVTSTTVAKRVKARLHDSRSAEGLLGKVSVAPV